MAAARMFVHLICVWAIVTSCAVADDHEEEGYFTPEEVSLDLDSTQEVTFVHNMTSEINMPTVATGWNITVTNITATIRVNVTITSDDTDIVSVTDSFFSQLLSADDMMVNITFSLTSTDEEGDVNITAEVSWCEGDNVTQDTYTLPVTVEQTTFLELNMNYALIYVNMMVAFISIIFVGCDVSPNDFIRTWGKTSIWVLAGFLIYALLRPVVTLILVKMLHFSPPASVGLLAAVCAPPSLLAIPLTSVLRGDVALVSVLALAADIVGAAVMPMWVLQFGRMDSNIQIEPSQVAYSVIILFFLLPVVALASGMFIRRMRPDTARSMSRVTPAVCFVTLAVSTSLDIYNLADTVRFVGAATGVFGALEPLAVLLSCFLAAVLAKLDNVKMKALAAFLLLKGQSVSVATLTNAQVKADALLSVAACSYLCLLCLLVAMVLACLQCICGRDLDPDREQFAEELVTEINEDEEAPFYSFGAREEQGEKSTLKGFTKKIFPDNWGLPGSWVWM